MHDRRRRLTTLRLLADDLTGALDTAAELVGLVGPLPCFWHGAFPSVLPENAALDSGTRELAAPPATEIVASLTAHLADASIAYKKIDSLLRGSTLAELAACLRAGAWDRCVLAPAFPYQGRVTRNGRQYARQTDGRWTPVGPDLVTALQAQGVEAQPGNLDSDLPPGISVFDAETDSDLQRVAETAQRSPFPILWSGTGGLAQALAHQSAPPRTMPWPQPILGLFGTDQETTAAQLAACEKFWLHLPHDSPAAPGHLQDHLRAHGAALASLDLPAGLTRQQAAARIEAAMHALIEHIDPPGTLIVAGGETLRALCTSLGARSLEVHGRVVPGMPRSILRGGRWDGTAVISKSGAFGHQTLLRDLLRAEFSIRERTA